MIGLNCGIFTRAKTEQLQILADEIQAIADEPQPGEVVTIKGDEREVKISDMLEHRKLRIDSRKWLLSKLDPKKYGDKTAAMRELRGCVMAANLAIACYVKPSRPTIAELEAILQQHEDDKPVTIHGDGSITAD